MFVSPREAGPALRGCQLANSFPYRFDGYLLQLLVAMKILIAPDKFKGGQTAREVANNMAAGICDVLRDAQIEIAPVADGGEGTADVICDALSGTWRECQAHDALGRPVTARYAWLPERATAVMEMSEVAGLKHLRLETRDLEQATTFGVGEMMLDAVKLGAREIVVGVGGSLTNDGGFGMARVLGFRFFDGGGKELKGGVIELRTLARIDTKDVVGVLVPSTYLKDRRLTQPPLQRVRVVAAADVQNPLLGEHGATRVFGPQKGATTEQLNLLEEALERLADIVARDLGVEERSALGAGAGGGLAFGLMSFSGATIRRGFEVVAEAIGLEDKMRGADIVVTGEGSLDRQSLNGKAPVEVARLARQLGKPIFAVVGRTDGDPCLTDLFDGIYATVDPARSEAENIARAAELLRRAGRELASSLPRG